MTETILSKLNQYLSKIGYNVEPFCSEGNVEETCMDCIDCIVQDYYGYHQDFKFQQTDVLNYLIERINYIGGYHTGVKLEYNCEKEKIEEALDSLLNYRENISDDCRYSMAKAKDLVEKKAKIFQLEKELGEEKKQLEYIMGNLSFYEAVKISAIMDELNVRVEEKEEFYQVSITSTKLSNFHIFSKEYSYFNYFKYLKQNHSFINYIAGIEHNFHPLLKSSLKTKKYPNGIPKCLYINQSEEIEYAIICELYSIFEKMDEKNLPCYLSSIISRNLLDMGPFFQRCQVRKEDNKIILKILTEEFVFLTQEGYNYLEALNFMMKHFNEIEKFDLYFLKPNREIPKNLGISILNALEDVFKDNTGIKNFFPEIIEKLELTPELALKAHEHFNHVKVFKLNDDITISSKDFVTVFNVNTDEYCYYNFVKFVMENHSVIINIDGTFLHMKEGKLYSFCGEIDYDAVCKIFNLLSENKQKPCFLNKVIENNEIEFNISEKEVVERLFDIKFIYCIGDNFSDYNYIATLELIPKQNYLRKYKLSFETGTYRYESFFKHLQDNWNEDYDFSEFGDKIPKMIQFYILNTLADKFTSYEEPGPYTDTTKEFKNYLEHKYPVEKKSGDEESKSGDEEKMRKFNELVKYFSSKEDAKKFIIETLNDDYDYL